LHGPHLQFNDNAHHGPAIIDQQFRFYQTGCPQSSHGSANTLGVAPATLGQLGPRAGPTQPG
jgi:hypothetical protein